MKNYNTSENPEFLNNYIVHIKVIRGLTERTVSEYYLDVRLFLKYIFALKNDLSDDISDVDISGMTEDYLKTISVSDIYNFLYYTADERNNSERARYRKVSSLRSFFKYLTKTAHIITEDPTKDLDIRVPRAALPVHLSLNDSLRLLEATDSTDSVRDYCIITLFLNCGMRLSELVGINIKDLNFDDNSLRVIGKGRKMRMVYLNEACLSALDKYLKVRLDNPKAKEEPALFISNQNRRISRRRVQQIVEDSLRLAGLSGKGVTTHKLRHTAATLMYQYGGADVLTLKELLGHASVSTTEIYTHLSEENVRSAVENNPLADVASKKDTDKK